MSADTAHATIACVVVVMVDLGSKGVVCTCVLHWAELSLGLAALPACVPELARAQGELSAVGWGYV